MLGDDQSGKVSLPAGNAGALGRWPAFHFMAAHGLPRFSQKIDQRRIRRPAQPVLSDTASPGWPISPDDQRPVPAIA